MLRQARRARLAHGYLVLSKQRGEDGVETLAACGGGPQTVRVEDEKTAILQRTKSLAVERRFDIRANFAQKARAGDAFGETQPHHQELVAPLPCVERRRLLLCAAAALDRREPSLRRATVANGALFAIDRKAAMRPRADPEIVAVAPVDEIVPALPAGPRVVRYLVGRQPGSFEDVLRRLVEG